jgi:peptide/nickel transport system ATP-binding protein
MGVVLITHDLGVVAESCDRVVVMYAGRKVEEAGVVDLFDHPLHPYTRALMGSMPLMHSASERLAEIPGMVPSLHDLGPGCAFAERCPYAESRCRESLPALVERGASHWVACFAVEEHRLDAGATAA